MRWLAVVGQILATAVAVGGLKLRLPLTPIAAVILITALSNAMLVTGMKISRPPAWLIQVVLLLDVLLLTTLLYLTGGPQNPFAALYLVHVAMAVIVLGAAWSWAVVGAVAICYGLLLRYHLPLSGTLPHWATVIGSWIALALVSVLIAGFIGRVTRSLRQREHELAILRDHAAKNEQLAALTTLAAGAAHELNTPLGTIAVVARELELSCNSAGGSDSVIDDAQLIRREVDRCRQILNRMRLDLGEEHSQRSTAQLDELVAHLRESLSDTDRDRLRINCPSDIKSVRAPSRALEQALLVLVRNAFDASPPNAHVALDVTRQQGHIRFDIRDRGCGMSDDLLRRAGEPFFTTKEPGKGMGLGLFLVRLVAERCGAAFSLNSRLGEGTTCVFELPEAN